MVSFLYLFYFFLSQETISVSAIQRVYPETADSSAIGPSINDPTLMTELYFRGLSYPTDMEFIDRDYILVTEKDTDIVQRIINGTMLHEPLLDVNVATAGHRGMLDIDIDSSNNNTSISGNNNKIDNKISINSGNNISSLEDKNLKTRYIFLYYTASQKEDGEDITQGKQPWGNFVYRYQFVNNEMINPKLLLDLPATPGAIGNGDKILVNPKDKNLYITIGGVGVDDHKTKAQNLKIGTESDGTSGILVIDQDGKVISENNTLGNTDPLNKYYAYGLWNSFGIDFDPISGNLWDIENGVVFGDEINLVYPGFNSGWNKVDGIWLRGYTVDNAEDHPASNKTLDDLLVEFSGKGKYSPPEFTWFDDVGPTAIRFLTSDKLGDQYKNDIFVGDIINGNIYHFDLNKERTELLLSSDSPLSDKIVSSNESRSTDEIIFSSGFGGITDIEVGPDGYRYILTFQDGEGSIYRIVPKINISSTHE